MSPVKKPDQKIKTINSSLYKDLTKNEAYIFDKIAKLRSGSRSVKIFTKTDTSIFKKKLLETGVFFFRVLPKNLQHRMVKSISSINYDCKGEPKFLLGSVKRKDFKRVKWIWPKLIHAFFMSFLTLDFEFERVEELLTNSICCRDMVEAYNRFDLAYKGEKFQNINSPKKLAGFFSSHKEYIVDEPSTDGNRDTRIPDKLEVDKNNFHEEIAGLVKSFFELEEKEIAVSYTWDVRFHHMGIRLIKKDDRVIMTMYDPTISTVHKRFVFTNHEDVKKLTVKDFVSSRILRWIYDMDHKTTIKYSHTLAPKGEKLERNRPVGSV